MIFSEKVLYHSIERFLGCRMIPRLPGKILLPIKLQQGNQRWSPLVSISKDCGRQNAPKKRVQKMDFPLMSPQKGWAPDNIHPLPPKMPRHKWRPGGAVLAAIRAAQNPRRLHSGKMAFCWGRMDWMDRKRSCFPFQSPNWMGQFAQMGACHARGHCLSVV